MRAPATIEGVGGAVGIVVTRPEAGGSAEARGVATGAGTPLVGADGGTAEGLGVAGGRGIGAGGGAEPSGGAPMGGGAEPMGGGAEPIGGAPERRGGGAGGGRRDAGAPVATPGGVGVKLTADGPLDGGPWLGLLAEGGTTLDVGGATLDGGGV